ncbi:BatA domain-containing protein, partial [Haliangium sp.]|uniref:BatA domain-containing protein n=1 Tax=Haliangium sp. TaxID=2663208 RepID=UPI003D09A6A5
MEFLTPLMLLGAAGVAVPVAIHLIGRRRARVVPFAAMDFLLGDQRKTARRLRLRELALLAARVFMCLAIPMILAKPYASC